MMIRLVATAVRVGKTEGWQRFFFLSGSHGKSTDKSAPRPSVCGSLIDQGPCNTEETPEPEGAGDVPKPLGAILQSV